MATFKVGQRVRFITRDDSRIPFGIQGTVSDVHVVMPVVSVVFDGLRSSGPTGAFICTPHELVPLTDPKADAFLESIRQLKPLNIQETV